MCRFRIPFPGDAESLTQRARQEISQMGGNLNGDSSHGDFRAKTPLGFVEGTYQISNQEIFFIITKKPFLVSCKKIEKELREVIT